MLRLKRLEVEGFGPFADTQVLDFPQEPGITVVYGENMRGKTSLLNAVRFAFFGTVLGRGARVRKLHTVSNRELAAEGKFGFSVTLSFSFDDEEYELFRTCIPRVATPTSDGDYAIEVLLKRGGSTLGPQERDKALQHVFPAEVARFFLFDGELLQEYEELLINESETGHKISEAIERILGIPILKNARTHLVLLSDEADKAAAIEASRHQKTQALGASLQAATAKKEAHKKELARLQEQLQELLVTREELEQEVKASQKYGEIVRDLDTADSRLKEVKGLLKQTETNLQITMQHSWRSLLGETIRAARERAQEEARLEYDGIISTLRARALENAHCEVCEQDLVPESADALRAKVPIEVATSATVRVSLSMTRLADLNKFKESDNTGEVRLLSSQLEALRLEEAKLRERIGDLKLALRDTDPEAVRQSNLRFYEVLEKISAIKLGIDQEKQAIVQQDNAIKNLSAKLQEAGTPGMEASQQRARLLRLASEVIKAAVERYKSDLRSHVETTATQLFLELTTEKADYAGLAINESYGLTIRHRDGRAEEARSAGAEHVVALALMGALQKNAPLRGPIVMDSPFGRLDESHTKNVVTALPKLADQVVLLVYESEVGRATVRGLLGSHLSREYELQRVSARRTNIREVR